MKVAIPRHHSTSKAASNRRIQRACEACHQRKTKCNGDIPRCRQCEESKSQCVYPLKWREKTKRQIGSLEGKVNDYEAMLKEMEHLIHGQSAERVRHVLQKFDRSSADVSAEVPRPAFKEQARSPKRSRSVSSNGSLEGIDRVEEDLNSTENSRATGFMGKSSEVTWMRRIQEEADQHDQSTPKVKSDDQGSDERIPPETMNYHLDDQGIGAPGPVQMYWVPSRENADHMFQTYLRKVHPHFPIINRTLFCVQYDNFYNDVSYPGDKWMAILNMIFAIATHYLSISDPPQRRDTTEHLFFLTRARMLSMGGDSIFQHPDLQQVQIEGLIAFYLLSTNQINRAWRISALAIRSAITLGLNNKTTTRAITTYSKEMRCRVWWCLYSTEHRLGSMTGRGTAISLHMYTSYLPIPFDEEQFNEPAAATLFNNPELRDKRLNMAMISPHLQQPGSQQTQETLAGRSWLSTLSLNPSLYFLYYCDLIAVNQEILDRVYTPKNLMLSWEDIKCQMTQLRKTVESWLSALPPVLNFTSMKSEDDQTYWAKTNLAFHYYSTQILLGRPALCRHTTHQNESDSQGVTQQMAMLTLESAIHMLDLLPNEPSSTHAYQFCPWWCFLHYIMQTATVVILELSFECFHMPNRKKDVVQAAEKSVKWLQTMSKHCMASRRAWQLCETALHRLMSNTGPDDNGNPSPDQKQKHILMVPAGLTLPMNIDDGSGTQILPHHDQAHIPAPSNETFDASQYQNSDVTTSLAFEFVPVTSGLHAGDAYFPHDPISDEFIRYIFPDLNAKDHLASGACDF